MNTMIMTTNRVVNEALRLPAVGYRFDPTDQELIVNFLSNKVHGNQLPSPNPVIDCDVYGDGCPWKRLFEECEENALYFFTRLKNKNGKGKRINRETDSGTWRVQSDKEIFSYGDQRVLIGCKRSFSFIPRTGVRQETRGRWVMHEYRLDGCSLLDRSNGGSPDYVLCRIVKKKLSKGAGKRSNTNDESDQDQIESIKTGNVVVDSETGTFSSDKFMYCHGTWTDQYPNYGMEQQTGDAGGLVAYGMEPPTGDMNGFQGTLNNHEGGSMSMVQDLHGCVYLSDNMEAGEAQQCHNFNGGADLDTLDHTQSDVNDATMEIDEDVDDSSQLFSLATAEELESIIDF
ncbi:hypothetical protein QYF36_011188 [Acer negundo]|nr:hypothetical protein QYF36_011188 [Acer negundo]